MDRLYPPPIISRAGASMSTLSTPNNEEELEAARDVLRAVITKHSSTSSPNKQVKQYASVASQTDGVLVDGLIRAAGRSLTNFAAEIKSLERKMESQNFEILNEIRKLRSDFS